MPGDKSISHRALILAALAEGNSSIQGAGDGADVRSAVQVKFPSSPEDFANQAVPLTWVGLFFCFRRFLACGLRLEGLPSVIAN